MDISSINTVNPSYNLFSNLSQAKVEETSSIAIQVNRDYTDFSIDYSNHEISSILDSIKSSFNTEDNLSLNTIPLEKTFDTLVVGYSEKYGGILKNINESNFDKDTKTQLTKILDKSFDDYADYKSDKIGTNISSFFNRAELMKEAYTQNNGNKLDLQGEKLVNKEDIQKNIRNMFSGAKTFYKNNLDGTEDQLNGFLQEKFSKTESVETLSYSDYKLLENELNNMKDHKEKQSGSIFDYYEEESKSMNDSLNNLTKEGASSALVNTFEKAVKQNDNCNTRRSAYAKIRFAYDDKIDKLIKELSKNGGKLDALKKEREEAIKEYNKKEQELKMQAYKMYKLMLMLNKDLSAYDPIKQLKEQHEKQLEIFEKREKELTDRQKEISNDFSETIKSYREFNEKPASAIDDYLGMRKEQKEEYLKKIQ